MSELVEHDRVLGVVERDEAVRENWPHRIAATICRGGQQVEHIAVTALGLRRRRCHRFELRVDAGEEFGQAPGSRPGWEDALLVVQRRVDPPGARRSRRGPARAGPRQVELLPLA
ncbi:hypothetical protein OG978_43705 (plasmid) [Streptomyces sp. NBC_01591]|uniref:hypothetical protein n=1 Tax=Streptomyces sp. NBC_01591 TaxID=2975888 RepID=UPI002DD7FDC6|nr:hypothetical protein [Streptomyces sp. NBC_01591]WSD74059.1 hypothetical protein OG978_43705 [Streptomyces sp. NBC_01591]